MKPWDSPGYRFFTAEMQAWMGGYAPVLAAEMCRPAAGKPRTIEAEQQLALGRQQGAKARRFQLKEPA